jgi:hypothetical protein
MAQSRTPAPLSDWLGHPVRGRGRAATGGPRCHHREHRAAVGLPGGAPHGTAGPVDRGNPRLHPGVRGVRRGARTRRHPRGGPAAITAPACRTQERGHSGELLPAHRRRTQRPGLAQAGDVPAGWRALHRARVQGRGRRRSRGWYRNRMAVRRHGTTANHMTSKELRHDQRTGSLTAPGNPC